MAYGNILKDKEKMKVLARIIAHLMGNGCVTRRYFAYYNKDDFFIKQFQERY